MSALILTDVEKSFLAGQPVLRSVDLTVEPGTMTALLGASGSGKTTLLRLIAGFDRVDRGTIVLDGRVVESTEVHQPPEDRRVGIVTQDGALFPHLDVHANVAFGLKRKDRHHGRVQDMLEIVGLTDLARRHPHELSGGERQRVALARALAIDPKLVLLDEPFSSLDAALRQTLRAEVRTVLAAAEATTLLITHDQDEALSLADRVAVLRDGRIIQHGTPRDLYNAPVDEQLAAFLGNATIVEATSHGDHADTPLGPVRLRKPPSSTASPDIRVLFRPEHLHVDTTADTARLNATVVDVTYMGHLSLIRLRLLDPPDGGTVIARTAGDDTPAIGQRVALRTSDSQVAHSWSVDRPAQR
jgi:iron(III) transport system ATP-binding protein